jgi:kynureninase
LELSKLFLTEVEKRCPQLTLISPRDGAMRGSQVSFRFDQGYAAMQALIARGVIGVFRAPNVMRFGITPLYLDAGDIMAAVDVLEDVIANRLWDHPDYQRVAAVT